MANKEKEYCPKCGGNVAEKERPFAFSHWMYDDLYSRKSSIHYDDIRNNDSVTISKCRHCNHTWDDAEKPKKQN
jgi:hypothetical protein